MPEPQRVDAADFTRDFDRLEVTAAETGLIEVTRGKRVVGAYLSASELEAYRRLRANAVPQVLKAGEFDEDTREMLGVAAYGRITG